MKALLDKILLQRFFPGVYLIAMKFFRFKVILKHYVKVFQSIESIQRIDVSRISKVFKVSKASKLSKVFKVLRVRSITNIEFVILNVLVA